MTTREVSDFILLALPIAMLALIAGGALAIVILAPGFVKLFSILLLLPAGLWALALCAALEDRGHR